MNKDDSIEIRSEKVRNIIGTIPSRITRIGQGVFFIVFLVLGLAVYFIKYNNSYSTKTEIHQIKDTIYYRVYINEYIKPRIKKNQSIVIHINESVMVPSNIHSIGDILNVSKNGSFYFLYGSLYCHDIVIIDTIIVKAEIDFGKTTLFQRIIKKRY